MHLMYPQWRIKNNCGTAFIWQSCQEASGNDGVASAALVKSTSSVYDRLVVNLIVLEIVSISTIFFLVTSKLDWYYSSIICLFFSNWFSSSD